jgi:hypothetical protein
MTKRKIEVKGREITIVHHLSSDEYISLTDIARYKDEKRTDYLIQNWLRNRNTIEFLGIWERLNNDSFNPIEFDGIRNKAGLNSFILTTKQWVEKTNAIGLVAKTGRYGGTYAHKDIAFEFASWISVEFKLYMIKEFQRLQEKDAESLEWNIKRSLTKINYRIHTDAIQKNLIPPNLAKKEIIFVYANEADVLNMALFGITAKAWREQNPSKKGNIRDYANVAQLVCLSNLESINALLIKENISQADRLNKLNEIAIEQMKILVFDGDRLIKK